MVAQTVKNPHVLQETWVQTLGQEDPLKKAMATHSKLFFSILKYIFINNKINKYTR